jgi:hypothetical protein
VTALADRYGRRVREELSGVVRVLRAPREAQRRPLNINSPADIARWRAA